MIESVSRRRQNNFKLYCSQTEISKNYENFPINYALLQLTTTNNNILPSPHERQFSSTIVKSLTSDELDSYKTCLKYVEELALLLKPGGTTSSFLSRPMQRKLVTLINCQIIEPEGRTRCMRCVRSLGERTVTELILQHQNQHQLSTMLWAAVRGRGCQFLGPAMQEEVLKLVLLALEDGSDLSRKILVMYVVQKLEATFPQASKTSIGHVVQLLYRASCFKVSKRDGDSSLMTLKEEFRTYDALRREHDTQIVQIATEAGLRIAPDQWSALLYGDNHHKSHMQSIIDKQQSPSSFSQSVNELMIALQRTTDPANLKNLHIHLENLSNIDPSLDFNVPTSWNDCMNSLSAVHHVVFGLIDYMQNHGRNKSQESYNQHSTRYKVSFCRDLQTRGNCSRGSHCNFAHSEEELEKYRAKYKKNTMKNIMPHNQQQSPPQQPHKESCDNRPNSKVNMNNNFTKTLTQPPQSAPPAQSSSLSFVHNDATNSSSQVNTKSIPYRSENPLNHSSISLSAHHHHAHKQQQQHHLRPTNISNIYNSTGSSSVSSSSTPNLSQIQLSPNQVVYSKTPTQQGNLRFTFNATANNSNISRGDEYVNNYSQRPPFSAPPVASNNYNNKQMSPYQNSPMMMSPSMHSQTFSQPPPRISQGMNNGTAYYSQNIPSPNYRSNGCETNGKFVPWQRSPVAVSNHNYNSINKPISKTNEGTNGNRITYSSDKDEIDAVPTSMWHQPLPSPTPLLQNGSMNKNPSFIFLPPVNSSKDKFIRSDSILATSHADENFDNFTNNGKFGAIGIKGNETSHYHPSSLQSRQQWSGLQESFASFNLGNNFDVAGSSSNDSLTKNEDHQLHHYGLNGNFTKMQV